MKDPLAPLKPDELAAFYARMADHALAKNAEATKQGKACVSAPMAPAFLKKWLANRNTSTTFWVDPPKHMLESQKVKDALSYHRSVFLTEKKARLGRKEFPRYEWVGVLPRLQGSLFYNKWSAPGTQITLRYSSNVEWGGNLAEIYRIRDYGTPDEKDLFGSLRGWTLKSVVVLSRGAEKQGKVQVKFDTWECSGNDNYDFSKVKHLSLPNPDYRSTAPGAIAPDQEEIRVRHSNAERLQRAALACPFKVRIKSWNPANPALKAPAEVDMTRDLTR